MFLEIIKQNIRYCVFAVHFSFSNLHALSNDLETQLKEVEQKVIDKRRDIHQNPALGNREFRIAAMITTHLESLGIAVQNKGWYH